MSDVAPSAGTTAAPLHNSPKWQPIRSLDRRVLGVLIEKAKTTPEQYPLSLNGIVNGCNQKSNRYPLMEQTTETVEQSLERLRKLGAVAEIQGGGRVAKFRHLAYDWLGVEKAELSVMAELLLRGAQTEGELRGRVSRMDNIPDLNAMRALINVLKAKKLVISITPEGRGHVVTHALYEERELDKVKAEFQASAAARATDDEDADSPAVAPVRSQGASVSSEALTSLRQEVAELQEQLAALRRDFEALRATLS